MGKVKIVGRVKEYGEVVRGFSLNYRMVLDCKDAGDIEVIFSKSNVSNVFKKTLKPNDLIQAYGIEGLSNRVFAIGQPHNYGGNQ